jgi:magnesium-transporting ATPase (P-type)
LVKNKLKKVCLAIGDGQNDIHMIRAAKLFGQEGMGAVQASDYALP